MYKITHFDKKLCRLLRQKFDLIGEDCDIYSIWRFCPNARWENIKTIFSTSPFCHADWFPVVYWIVLTISACGTIYSLMEFTSLFWGGRKRVSMWRQRKYYVLPYTVVRKCRLVGAVVMLNAWLMLVYAVVNVSPSHMTPWLTINVFVLSFELITFILEILLGTTKLNLYVILSFVLPLLNFLFVRCVKNVFEQAIEMNDVEDLRLWKREWT